MRRRRPVRRNLILFPTPQNSQKSDTLFRFAFIFFMIIIVGAMGYFVFLSNYFIVHDVAVTGTKAVSREEVKKSAEDTIQDDHLWFLPKKHIFAISKNDLRKKIESDFPSLQDVRIEKKLPNTLKIIVEERTAVAVWYEGSTPYLVDSKGNVINKISKQDIDSSLPQIIDSVKAENVIMAGDFIVHPQALERIITARQVLPTKIGVTAQKITMPTGFALEFTVTTSEGWYVIFDRERSMQSQVETMQTMLQEEIGDKRPFLRYIDLRVKDVGYFR